jgi:ArsR family transcriptional regulator
MNPLDEPTAHQLAGIFSALSDPTRLRIISMLVQGEQSVGDIATKIGLSKSATSHQLKGLRQMRLVKVRKAGRYVYYCLDDEHVTQLFQLSLEHVAHG